MLARVVRVIALLGGALVAVGCASTTTRVVPVGGLLERAREGQEPAPSARGRVAVQFAASQLGRSYCWGGRGPSCFDCSGLVQKAWASAGIALPRTSSAMGAELQDVPLADVREGDILWWPGHVGLYAGQGWSIEALDSRHGIVRRPARNPYRVLRPAGVD